MNRITMWALLCRLFGATPQLVGNDARDAARYRWLEANSALGFDGAPSWGAVLRIPSVNADDYKLSQIIDAAMGGRGE